MKTYDFSICVSNHKTSTEKWYNSDDFYSYDDMHDAIVDDIGNGEEIRITSAKGVPDELIKDYPAPLNIELLESMFDYIEASEYEQMYIREYWEEVDNETSVSAIKDMFGGETDSFYKNTAVELLTNKYNVKYDDVDELLQFINVEELVDYRYRFEITKTTNFVFWF